MCVCPYSVSFSGPKSAGKGHWTATVTTPAPYWKVQRFSSRSTLSGHTKQKSALRRDTGLLHERSEKRRWVPPWALWEETLGAPWALWEETLGAPWRSEKRRCVLHDDLRRDAACSISVTFLCCVEEGLWAAVLKKESYCHGKLLREVRRERLCQGKRSTSSNWKFSHFLCRFEYIYESRTKSEE